jgi:hypothetical protein
MQEPGWVTVMARVSMGGVGCEDRLVFAAMISSLDCFRQNRHEVYLHP